MSSPTESGVGVMDRTDWLAERRTYIGASEAADAAGIGYSSPRSVWMHKKGLLTTEETLPMRLGNHLEPFVATLFAEHMGIPPSHLDTRTLTRSAEPFIACNPDRVWLRPDGVLANVQLKTADRYAVSDFGRDGSDEVPVRYLIQVVYEMHCLGAEVGYLAVLFGFGEFRVFHFEWNDLTRRVLDEVLNRVRALWRQIEEDEPPELTGADCDTEIAKRWAAETSDRPLPKSEWGWLCDDLGEKIPDWAEKLKARAALDLQIAAYENRLREEIHGTDGVQCAYGYATYRRNKNGAAVLRYDWKKDKAIA